MKKIKHLITGFFLFVILALYASCDLLTFKLAGTKWKCVLPTTGGSLTIELNFTSESEGTITYLVSNGTDPVMPLSMPFNYTWDVTTMNGKLTSDMGEYPISVSKDDKDKLKMEDTSQGFSLTYVFTIQK